jgi:hypothetical protein
LDTLLTERDTYERSFHSLRAQAKIKPRDCTLSGLAIMAQDRFDIINDLVPERCRKELKHRMTQVEQDEAVARIKAAKPGRRAGQPKPKTRRRLKAAKPGGRAGQPKSKRDGPAEDSGLPN